MTLPFFDQFWPQLLANFLAGVLVILPALYFEAWLDERRDKRHERRERAYFKVAVKKR